jgi:putative ABC transport system substrate-binding protein
MPTIGLLGFVSPDGYTARLRGFHRGLKETGYVEGENLTIISRWAENQPDRLPELASDLVRQKVAVIVAAGAAGVALAAKAATKTIPVIFVTPEDPVRLGLVASLARPGGNATGINFLNVELGAKRLELIRVLIPAAARLAILVDPTVPSTGTILKDTEAAARSIGLSIKVVRASTKSEIDVAFATFARDRPDALIIGGAPLFTNRRVQLVQSVTRHAIPAIFPNREAPEIGGLMSYGSNVVDEWRQLGVYTGRILKGEKPADLPVVQASKFELVINVQTAKLLDLNVPATLLARADEVIE